MVNLFHMSRGDNIYSQYLQTQWIRDRLACYTIIQSAKLNRGLDVPLLPWHIYRIKKAVTNALSIRATVSRQMGQSCSVLLGVAVDIESKILLGPFHFRLLDLLDRIISHEF
jgi:hypothetical protein